MFNEPKVECPYCNKKIGKYDVLKTCVGLVAYFKCPTCDLWRISHISNMQCSCSKPCILQLLQDGPACITQR